MMRYVPNDKYTIAWFKLAECVAKGEKEKAFGVYRLLMHSLEDQAYAYQLEGDLLHAFEDERAVEKYAHAAHLYTVTQRYKDAAQLYMILIFLVPNEQRYVFKLLELYKEHLKQELLVKKLNELIDTLFEKKLNEAIVTFINFYQKESDENLQFAIYDKMIRTCAIYYTQSQEILAVVLEKTITIFTKPEQCAAIATIIGMDRTAK